MLGIRAAMAARACTLLCEPKGTGSSVPGSVDRQHLGPGEPPGHVVPGRGRLGEPVHEHHTGPAPGHPGGEAR